MRTIVLLGLLAAAVAVNGQVIHGDDLDHIVSRDGAVGVDHGLTPASAINPDATMIVRCGQNVVLAGKCNLESWYQAQTDQKPSVRCLESSEHSVDAACVYGDKIAQVKVEQAPQLKRAVVHPARISPASSSPMVSAVSQISDGQVQASTQGAVIATAQPDVTSYGTVSTMPVPSYMMSEISDGQPQAPTQGLVSEISDGQAEAPTSESTGSATTPTYSYSSYTSPTSSPTSYSRSYYVPTSYTHTVMTSTKCSCISTSCGTFTYTQSPVTPASYTQSPYMPASPTLSSYAPVSYTVPSYTHNIESSATYPQPTRTQGSVYSTIYAQTTPLPSQNSIVSPLPQLQSLGSMLGPIFPSSSALAGNGSTTKLWQFSSSEVTGLGSFPTTTSIIASVSTELPKTTAGGKSVSGGTTHSVAGGIMRLALFGLGFLL